MNVIVLLIVISLVIGEFLFKGRLYDLKRRDLSSDAMGIVFDKIFKVDNRMLMYAVLSIPITIIAIIQILRLLSNGVSQDAVSKLILCLIMIVVNYLFAMLSRHIIGIEESKIKVKDIIRVMIVYAGFNLYYSLYLGKETVLLKSFIIIILGYNILKESLFAYVFIWFNNFLGKEKTYESEKIQIIKIYGNTITRYKIFLKEIDKTFVLSEEVIEECADKLQGTVFEGSLKVKSSLLCNRMIITEIW